MAKKKTNQKSGRRLTAQQIVFLVISVLIVLTMVLGMLTNN